MVAGRPHGCFKLLRSEDPPFAGKRIGHSPCECCRASCFIVASVGCFIHDDLIARPAVDAEGDLIAHGPRRQVDGILFAQKIADHFHQSVDRRIFLLLFVSHFGFGHEFPHSLSGFCDRIAEEVDSDRCVHGSS